ncbi:MAG TPA: LuxR C-terminal-related transcriptional regulator, partial [Catenuloplanes sp.]
VSTGSPATVRAVSPATVRAGSPATVRAVFVLGASGRIRDLNETACALLEQPAEGLRGRPLHSFVEDGHRSQLARLDEDLRAGRSDHYRTVVSFGPPPEPDHPQPAPRQPGPREPGRPEPGRPEPGGRPWGRPVTVRATRLIDGTVVMVEPVTSVADPASPAVTLTPVEAALLELTAQGLTTGQIAKRLHYSDGNVNYHLAGLGARFGTSNRTALVSRAYVLGFLRRDAWPPKAAGIATQDTG